MNGEAFEFSGSYSETQTFSASVDFADITLNLTETTSDKGFEIALAADVREFGQLQDALRFTRVLEGKGTVGLVFSRFDGVSRIDDLDVQLALEEGQSLSVTGQVGELGKPDDVQLVTKIRLYPEDATPPATTTRYDLKLVAIEMVMHAVPGQIPQRSMVIETNGFTLDTAGEGPPPISVRGLSRTENGALRIGNVHLRIGPTDKPFVILDGSVGDALQLAEIEVSGVMDVTAGSLIGPQLRDKEEILGGFKGDFLLTGSAQELSLSDLDASTTDTDLWTLKVTGSVRNVLKFEGLTLDVDVAVPSGAELMEAMEIKPIDTGVAHLALAVKSHGTDWSGKGQVTLGKSGLNLTLEVVDVTNDPVVRGLLESDLILVQELRHIFAAAIELRELGERIPASEDEDPPPVLRNVTLKPIGRAVFLSGMDLDVDIDLRKIEGSSGVNSLESEVTIKDSLLNVGPLKFNFEGAAFDVHGSMDLAQETYPLTLKGTAGGWKLHDLLEFMNFRKAASGTFYTNFDVTGKSDSVKNFLATMTGHATLSMRNGSIETQLLDIAGLGVLPWLFSENKEKIVPIVCMNAPFTLSNGVISTDDTTLETNLVQVIAFGKVGLGQRTIDMNIQPRKIGEPLSRSPWPVTLTGALTDPNVKVKDGPRRLKRADGATQMPAERKLCVPDILQLQ